MVAAAEVNRIMKAAVAAEQREEREEREQALDDELAQDDAARLADDRVVVGVLAAHGGEQQGGRRLDGVAPQFATPRVLVFRFLDSNFTH